MKYIRTEKGIYKLVDTYYMCVDGIKTYMYADNGRGIEINGKQILKQADTIEELCDEFLIVYYDKKVNRDRHYFTNLYKNACKGAYAIKNGIKCDFEIYGCIWV